MAKKKKTGRKVVGAVKPSAADVEVVVFEDRAKKRKIAAVERQKAEEEAAASKPFDFKRARHEVFKFALSGMDTQQRMSAKERHLISLGAKPEKARPKNYKLLTEERKAQKAQQQAERQEGNQRFNISSQTFGSKKTRKRDPNAPRGGIDYQVGKFKDGVQFVNKKQLLKK